MGVAHDDASKRTAKQVDSRKIGALALARWHSDPISFSREVLRTCLWARQADILLATRDHRRVAIRSGHKCGKTTALACLALWWVCTRPRARVIMTAASYRQVASVLWREVRRLHRGARVPIGGDMHESPESGLQFKSGAEIIGFSTKEPERMAGFSGPDMLFLVDEASGVPDSIFEAIEGNRAGGARVVMISNPTQLSLVESVAQTWETCKAQIDTADNGAAVTLLGQNLTTQVTAGTNAAATVHGRVAFGRTKADAVTLPTCLHDQALTWWAEFNFGSASLAPWPVYDTTPAEDLKELAAVVQMVSQAASAFVTARAPVDLRALCERFKIPTLLPAETARVLDAEHSEPDDDDEAPTSTEAA